VLLSALAPLQRYIGLAVTVTAGIVILVENRRSIRTLLRDGFILGFVSLLPIAWWLIVHNIITYGSLWGVGPQVIETGTNISLALTKMLHWFIPYLAFLMPILMRPLIPLGAIAFLLFMLNRNQEGIGRAWLQALAAPSVYPTMVYAVVYFAAIAATAVTADQRDLFADRYYVILLVPTAVLILLTFDLLLLPHLSGSLGQAALIFMFALWSIYPLYSFREYLHEARQRGEPSGANMFNNQTYHEMTLIPELQKIKRDQPDMSIYSNYSDAVWFYTRQPVTPLPVVDDDPSITYAGSPFHNPG